MMENRQKPNFLITIDTEGDHIWSKPQEITTQNAAFLPRFQSLCESYQLKPTYLTNYEMALSPLFQEFGKDLLQRQTGEIGMHLHAWNNPPFFQLTPDDFRSQPYLIEYPTATMQEKITVMTDLLEEVFQTKMRSHRAGRWSFNEAYAQILVEQGYSVDCSVTPHVSWQGHLGDPAQQGGTDYSHFPEDPYFLDLQDISCAGSSSLLELPMTTSPIQPNWVRKIRKKVDQNSSLLKRGIRRLFPTLWLRPNGKNIANLLRLLRHTKRTKKSYAQFMLHSSELMPGGSPTFPENRDIEQLYADLEILFSHVQGHFWGETLSGYHQKFVTEHLLQTKAH